MIAVTHFSTSIAVLFVLSASSANSAKHVTKYNNILLSNLILICKSACCAPFSKYEEQSGRVNIESTLLLLAARIFAHACERASVHRGRAFHPSCPCRVRLLSHCLVQIGIRLKWARPPFAIWAQREERQAQTQKLPIFQFSSTWKGFYANHINKVGIEYVT